MESSLCVVCNKRAAFFCSICRTVWYCSKLHQKSHWKVHKPNCPGKAYQIEEDVNTGHHLVASKDLEAGVFILQEQPLMLGGLPRKPENKKVCLGCYQKVAGRGVDCPGCKWPMCGKEKCWDGGSEHAYGECALLEGARERLPANYQNLWEPHFFYQGITVLRFLSLKEKDPSKWRELMSLKRCVSSTKLRALESLTREKIVPLVNQFLLRDAVPEEWIINIITMLSTNTLFSRELLTLYVYSVGSLFDHSCMANAEHTFTKSGKILVRSTLPIAKGAKITLNYSKNTLLGTKKRLQSLVLSKFMGKCQCQRCCDPTELETFTSGIFCAQCRKDDGILLPENPLDEESFWACNKCSTKKSAAFIAHFLENDVIQLVGRAREKISDCNSFVRKYGKVLHANHYVLTDIKMMLCQLAICEFATRKVIPDKEFSERESEILKLLALVGVISPGISQLRGKLLYFLAANEIGRLHRGIGITIMPDDALDSKLKGLLEMCREAYKIFHWGPEETIGDEHMFAKTAQKGCRDVEKSIMQLKHIKEHGVLDPNIVID